MDRYGWVGGKKGKNRKQHIINADTGKAWCKVDNDTFSKPLNCFSDTQDKKRAVCINCLNLSSGVVAIPKKPAFSSDELIIADLHNYGEKTTDKGLRRVCLSLCGWYVRRGFLTEKQWTLALKITGKSDLPITALVLSGEDGEFHARE